LQEEGDGKEKERYARSGKKKKEKGVAKKGGEAKLFRKGKLGQGKGARESRGGGEEKPRAPIERTGRRKKRRLLF